MKSAVDKILGTKVTRVNLSIGILERKTKVAEEVFVVDDLIDKHTIHTIVIKVF